MGGWGPTLYLWAQIYYNHMSQSNDTAHFSEESKAQLILIAFIWAAHWYWDH